jgi:hypothetical protein
MDDDKSLKPLEQVMVLFKCLDTQMSGDDRAELSITILLRLAGPASIMLFSSPPSILLMIVLVFFADVTMSGKNGR